MGTGPLLFAIFFGFLIAAPSAAQSFVYELSAANTLTSSPTTIRERAWVNGDLGEVLREASIDATAQSRPVVTYDARYVVWLSASPLTAVGPASVAYFDRMTGQAGVLPGLSVPTGTLFADQRALRLYIAHAFSVTIVDLAGLLTVSLPSAGGPFAFSPERGELFYLVRPAGGGPLAFQAVSENGVRTLPQVPADVNPTDMSVSPDGRRLFLITHTLGGEPSVHMLNASTGEELARRALPRSSTFWALGTASADERHQRLFLPIFQLGSNPTESMVWILDLATLDVIAEVDMAGHVVRDVHVDGDQSTVLSFASALGRTGCNGGRADIWDGTANPIRTVATGVCALTTVARRPQASGNLTATRVGRQVTLAWTGGLRSPEFIVEAGSSSGATDIATLRTNRTTVIVDNVPPGTYYVRVYAENATGRSASSNEIAVVVP